MRISDIFSQQPLTRSERTDESSQAQKRRERESLERGVRTSYGEDTITISPISRQLAQISRVVADDEMSTGERISSLKDQIEQGSYAVSVEDIARSLMTDVKDQEE